MVNTQHRQNDAVKAAARAGHSAAQIPQWPPSHPSKSRSPYSALEPVWWSPLSCISKLKFTLLIHWSTDHVPIILASLFFPHHAKCTRDEDGDVCIDHWGFICLDPGCLWTSFTLLLFWGGGLQLNIIYIYHSDTPPSIIFICIFFYLFLAALMIKPIVLHKWSNTEFHPQPFPVFFSFPRGMYAVIA